MRTNDAEAKRLTGVSVSSESSSSNSVSGDPSSSSASGSSISSSASGSSISSSASSSSVGSALVGNDGTEAPILRNGQIIPHLSPGEEDRQSGDIVSFDIDLGSLPNFVHEFCQQVGIDQAVVVEHLLLDAYQKILRDEDKNRFKSVLENEYAMGRISSDALEKAKYYDWLQDSDVEAIKRLRGNFRILLDEPSGS